MKIVTLLVLLFVLASNGFCQKVYYEDYLFPDGYVGWVQVQHEVEGASALPVENGRYIYKFDESGLLKTKTPLLAGSSYSNYYYYSNSGREKLTDSTGKEGMIWGEVVSNKVAECFFVGSLEYYSLWYESSCGKEKDSYHYSPKNIKQCLEDYKQSKSSRTGR